MALTPGVIKIRNSSMYGKFGIIQNRRMIVDTTVLSAIKLRLIGRSLPSIIQFCKENISATKEEVGSSISRLTHQHKIRNRGLMYEIV